MRDSKGNSPLPALRDGLMPMHTCVHTPTQTEIEANINVEAPMHALGCIPCESTKCQHVSEQVRIVLVALQVSIPEKYKQDC